MDQVIFIFLIITSLALIGVLFLLAKMRKTNGPITNDAERAGIAKELELLKLSYLELESRWREEQKLVKEKEELVRNIENNFTRTKAELDNSDKNLAKESEQSALLTKKLEDLAKVLTLEREERSNINAQLKAQEERVESQKKEVDNIQKRFTEQFEVLANKILEEKTQKFSELNKDKLDQILAPLNQNLKEFEKVVRETYDVEGKQRHSLGEEVKKLMELNMAISQETKDLTEALKGSPKQQGDWGETVLENILEQSGMTKGREYFIQESLRDEAGNIIKNEEGKIMRPDVIVQYPDKRKVIIDSKVSLSAYVEFTSSPNKEEQEKALKRHLLSVNKHIDDLNSKSYAKYGSDLDFVMMFVPIEGAYILSMQGNPNLWNEAYKKNVLLISPTNLIAALRLIVDMWDRDKQSKNAEEIAERGGKLYEKFVGFLQSMEEIGASLKKSQGSYEKAISQLSEGRGNLVNQAKQLEHLGIKYNKSKQIPISLLNDSDDDSLSLEEKNE